MKKVLFVLLMAFATVSNAATKQLSPNSEVILFTCTQGPELYAGFGHSALWVSDPENGIDRLYNYGTFDFDTPGFYTKFVRGKLDYMLSVTRLRRFLEEYNYRKLGVTGQTLNLSIMERQTVYDFMENNYLPENRFYKYDFFFDNCATRIRDVIFEKANGEKTINYKLPDQSLREMLFPYLTQTPWTKFGINMILGLPSDQKGTNWSCMFLPEMMQQAFQNTTINENGTSRKLVKTEVKYLDLRIDFTNKKYNDPIAFFGLIMLTIGILSFFEIKKGKKLIKLDKTIFTISVVAGLFLLFMWLGTDHLATEKNMNILWLLPAQSIYMFVLFSKKHWINLVRIAVVYQAIVCVAMFFWPQESELSFLFIAATYLIRMVSNLLKNKNAIG